VLLASLMARETTGSGGMSPRHGETNKAKMHESQGSHTQAGAGKPRPL